MDLQLKLLNRDQYLYATVSGEFSLAAFKKIYQRILDASVQSSQPCVIVDTRLITGDVTTMERYEFAVWAAQIHKASIRIVILASPEKVTPDRFVETVAVNRGIQLKVTTAMDEALQWLGVTPAVGVH